MPTELQSIFPRNFLGFDPLFREFDHFSRMPNENYPPHNIVAVDDDNLVIQLAVAGYSKEDVSIEIEEKLLRITGRKEVKENVNYLHKGISEKSFTKSFRLSEHIQIKNAEMENGMLKIYLEYIIPDEKKPKVIPINSTPQLSSD